MTLVIAAAGVVAKAGSGATGYQVGKPSAGSAGVQRTTAQIMAEQHAVGPRVPKALPLRLALLHRRPNPDSPLTNAALGRALATGPTSLTIGTSFTGATLDDSGFVPPDSMGAVGPTQFLVGVNGRIRIFSKVGVAGSLNADLDTFFSTVVSPGANTTDPRVRYDPLSSRWFVTCIDFDSSFVNNRVLLAVSKGSTITNSTDWSFFRFQGGDASHLADFPTLGIDANALYIGVNMFTSAGTFTNSTGFVVRKSSVTGAGPIVVTSFPNLLDGSFNGPYTPQGVDNVNPSAAEGYFIGVDVHAIGKLYVRRVGTPAGTPTLSINLPVSVPTDSEPINPSVSGSTKPLDGIDLRLTSSSIRNGKLYTAETIGVDGSGNPLGSPSRDAVQWYELANLATTPTLSRSGKLFDGSSSANSYWVPSIAVSQQGHAVIGMTTGGPSAHPNGAVSSMLSSESSFSTPINYTASSAGYNPSFDTGGAYRWGDYSHTSVDPCDGQTFWTIQEYVDSTDKWGVKVGKILAPPPAIPASASPSAVGAGQASVDVTLTGTSTTGSGFWDPGSGTCRIAASINGGVTVNSITFTDATHVTVNISTVGATAGSRTVTITNPDGQTSSAAVLSVGTVPANTGPPTITGTTGVGDTLTAGNGTWSGDPAPTFTYQWKQCDSDGNNCTPIGGATAGTYQIVLADQGYRLRVAVTGTNGSGSASADSATKDVTGAPTNLAPPTITGVAQVGSLLTAQKGSWTGVPAPTFTYKWQQCDAAGLNCTDIGGATAAMYTPVSADVGFTLRVQVSASNTGGTAGPVNSAVTAVVATAPSGGGGGGGGAGATDAVAALSASPATPGIGDTLTYVLTATMVTGGASDVKAAINLPAQVTLVSSYADRGSGCTGTTTLTCDLDFLGGGLVATVRVFTTVTASGTLVASASLTTTPADINPANNTASVTTVVGGSPPPPPPPPPPAPPVLKQLGIRTLAGVRHGSNEWVTTRFSTNERMRVGMTVTKNRSTTKLPLVKGSSIAGSALSATRLTVSGLAGHAGDYGLRVIVSRARLVKGQLYLVHLSATDARGRKTALTIRFRA